MSETGKTEFSPDEWRRHESHKHVFTGQPRIEITIVDLQTTNMLLQVCQEFKLQLQVYKQQTCFYWSAKNLNDCCRFTVTNNKHVFTSLQRLEITIEDLKTKNILLQVCQEFKLQL